MALELHSGIQARKIRLSLWGYEDKNVHKIFEEDKSLIQKYFFSILYFRGEYLRKRHKSMMELFRENN